jgi:hypothetical protein
MFNEFNNSTTNDLCNETDSTPIKSLTELLDDLNIDFNPDTVYDLASINDKAEFSLPNLAISAAKCNIQNFLHDYQSSNDTLQIAALRSFLKQFDLSTPETLFPTLCNIRDLSWSNMYICPEWDEIKCFLRLLSCSGIPTHVEFEDDFLFDDYNTTTIHFSKLTIEKTMSDDGFTSGFYYSLNKNYHQLRLILSGDVETNPGPPTHSKFCTDEKDKQ